MFGCEAGGGVVGGLPGVGENDRTLQPLAEITERQDGQAVLDGVSARRCFEHCQHGAGAGGLGVNGLRGGRENRERPFPGGLEAEGIYEDPVQVVAHPAGRNQMGDGLARPFGDPVVDGEAGGFGGGEEIQRLDRCGESVVQQRGERLAEA